LNNPADRPLRVLSYNIHKGFGPGNLRFTLMRIAAAIRTLEPDLVFLQEVVGHHQLHAARHPDWPIAGQLEALADTQWPHFAYGRNAVYDDGHHGNAILSRYPILASENIDVSQHVTERRGVLTCTLDHPELGGVLKCFCVHLALLRHWRQRQLGRLCEIVGAVARPDEPIIIAGDFNERGNHASFMLRQHLGMDDVLAMASINGTRTFPVAMPLWRLDRIYTRHLRPVTARTITGPQWRTLSDHAAVYAELGRARAAA
jgi:endonuclease/exonuclease/phosphatase family metal-dependent hydrolase